MSYLLSKVKNILTLKFFILKILKSLENLDILIGQGQNSLTVFLILTGEKRRETSSYKHETRRRRNT